MGTVVIDLSVSLDGYIAGPDDGPQFPLGRGGNALFDWMRAGPEENRIGPWFTPPTASRPIIEEWMSGAGALISGRRTFEIANGWKDGHPVDAPIFVVTHEPPTEGEWNPKLTFVPEGALRALELAQEVAGDGVVAVSGAAVAQQLLQAGEVDEIQVSITPLLLGSGVRLFDHIGPAPVALEQVRAIASDGVTHLRYKLLRG